MPMWTIVLIAVIGALAVTLNATLLIQKLKGNLDDPVGGSGTTLR